MPSDTASRADTNAAVALAKINEHIEQCSDRWRAYAESHRRLEDQIFENVKIRDRQHHENKSLLVTILVAVIGGVFGLAGALIPILIRHS